jgi:tryptophan halogenase
MRANRTDYFRNPDGTVNPRMARVSCHFDALKFGAWLREMARERENIRHVNDTIAGFELDPESGFITKVRTTSGRDVAGDFFLDCTGFHRLLLAKAYQPAWRSYADHIRVDSAIPFFQAYAPDRLMPTYTMATAMPHGWVWQIPTQSRLGRGYIFSSRYVDVSGAIADLRAAGLDPGDNPRVLRFEPGRFERQWVNNVCAIGLSGGFIEPLESSTIHGMYVQLRLLTELYLPYLTRASARGLAEQYDTLVAAAYEDYLEFVSFHYHGGRDDTEFWRDYQKPAAVHPKNQARMEKWRHAFPVREDFTPTYTQRVGHTTGLVIWAPVLCAFGFFAREPARRAVQMSVRGQMLKENVERYVQVRNRITATALTAPEAIRFCRED